MTDDAIHLTIGRDDLRKLVRGRSAHWHREVHAEVNEKHVHFNLEVEVDLADYLTREDVLRELQRAIDIAEVRDS